MRSSPRLTRCLRARSHELVSHIGGRRTLALLNSGTVRGSHHAGLSVHAYWRKAEVYKHRGIMVITKRYHKTPLRPLSTGCPCHIEERIASRARCVFHINRLMIHPFLSLSFLHLFALSPSQAPSAPLRCVRFVSILLRARATTG